MYIILDTDVVLITDSLRTTGLLITDVEQSGVTLTRGAVETMLIALGLHSNAKEGQPPLQKAVELWMEKSGLPLESDSETKSLVRLVEKTKGFQISDAPWFSGETKTESYKEDFIIKINDAKFEVPAGKHTTLFGRDGGRVVLVETVLDLTKLVRARDRIGAIGLDKGIMPDLTVANDGCGNCLYCGTCVACLLPSPGAVTVATSAIAVAAVTVVGANVTYDPYQVADFEREGALDPRLEEALKAQPLLTQMAIKTNELEEF